MGPCGTSDLICIIITLIIFYKQNYWSVALSRGPCLFLRPLDKGNRSGCIKFTRRYSRKILLQIKHNGSCYGMFHEVTSCNCVTTYKVSFEEKYRSGQMFEEASVQIVGYASGGVSSRGLEHLPYQPTLNYFI